MKTKEQDRGKTAVRFNTEDEWYTRWFTCVSCGCNDIAKVFKFCPGCAREIKWNSNQKRKEIK